MLSKYHLSAGGSEAGHGEGRPAVHLSPGVGNLDGHPVQVDLTLQAAVQGPRSRCDRRLQDGKGHFGYKLRIRSSQLSVKGGRRSVCTAGSEEQNRGGTLELGGECYPTRRDTDFPHFPMDSSRSSEHHSSSLESVGPGRLKLVLATSRLQQGFVLQASGPMGIAIRKQRQEPRRQKRSTTFHHPSGSVPHCSIYLSHAGHVLTLIHDVRIVKH